MSIPFKKSLMALALATGLIMVSGEASARYVYYYGGGYYSNYPYHHYHRNYYYYPKYYQCGWIRGHYDYYGRWIPKHRACWY